MRLGGRVGGRAGATRRQRQTLGAAAALMVAVLPAACSSGATRAAGPGAPGTSAPPATTARSCPTPATAEPVRFQSAGLTVEGLLLGRGPDGVVLSNQSDRDLCDWLPLAGTLAASGLRVMLYDDHQQPDDATSAASELRRLGAKRVLLMGASRGAKASLLAAATLRPEPAAVVSLSAERNLGPVDVLPAIARLRAPVLLVAARGDAYGAGDDAGDLYRAAAHARSRRLVLVGGSAHGVDLLAGSQGARIQAIVVEFLRDHAR